MPPASVAAAQAAAVAPYRVMLVDDSAVIRGFFRRTLETDPEIEVVASVDNGQFALDSMQRHEIDVVVLDIEMPVMDGLTALPKLLAADRTVKIIMASTLTLKNADISLKALAAGAADYIPKPLSASEIHSAQVFKRDLVEKVKALGAARRRNLVPARARDRAPKTVASPLAAAPYTLRDPSTAEPVVLGIGSSTGGPQALLEVIGGLPKDFNLPILVTQHMPATFTSILAEHIAAAAGRPAAEGKTGDPLERGHVYIAPGDHHMLVERDGAERVIRLTRSPPENYCRPSVDPMFASMAKIYGRNLLCAILTGMGHDGLVGAKAVIEAGGSILAQDEASSVVWGMPGAVATAGLCSAVLPLDEIALHVGKLSGRRVR